MKSADTQAPPLNLFPLLIACVFSTLIILLPTLFLINYYRSHFLPHTYVNDVNIGNYNFNEAQLFLEKQIPSPNFNLTLSAFTATSSSISSSAAQLGFYPDTHTLLSEISVFQAQKSSFNLLKRALYNFKHKDSFYAQYKYDSQSVLNFINQLKISVDEPGTPSALILGKSNKPETLMIEPGENGYELDLDQTLTNLKQDWQNKVWTSDAAVLIKKNQLDPDQITHLRQNAEKLVGKSINWHSSNINNLGFSLKDKDLIDCFTTSEEVSASCLKQKLEPLHSLVDRPARNPEFKYNPDTLEVYSFIPPLNGLTFDEDQTISDIHQTYNMFIGDPNLTSDQNINQVQNKTLELSAATQPPSIPLSTTNNLGINERIGFGESYYAHSIPGRIHNVALAASRVSLHIVPPGTEFSFNKALGDVSSESGYQPGYIISGGRSVLSDGGGVCQVSSTLFRALLNSGVKITKRLPHSYRVSYYELNNDPGFDATVFAGDVDLRFFNDTPGHILIYMTTDNKNLYMTTQLFGTADGRSTEITDYKKYGATPPPPTQYIPDPSLSPGQKKQIDWSAPGLKVSFTNVIKNKNGQEIRRDIYQSNYQAWSAKYLVGP